MNWGDFLIGYAAGILFTWGLLRYLVLPGAVDSFIKNGDGKAYDQDCSDGKTYRISIKQIGR